MLDEAAVSEALLRYIAALIITAPSLSSVSS